MQVLKQNKGNWQQFIYLFIYLFIHLIVYLFIYLFIYLLQGDDLINYCKYDSMSRDKLIKVSEITELFTDFIQLGLKQTGMKNKRELLS